LLFSFGFFLLVTVWTAPFQTIFLHLFTCWRIISRICHHY
jgi:hypothetical protein